MRARKYSVSQMAKLAIQHLERNISLLTDHTADRLRVPPNPKRESLFDCPRRHRP